MAKIDTSTIEGFDEMSAEDKLNALMGYEFEVPKTDNTEVERLKASLSKANSEAAEWKRQYRQTQTEQERASAEAQEELKRVMEENRLFKERDRISSYKNKLMTAGMDAETADVMANSLPEGVGDEYFAAYKSFIEAKTKEIESAALSKQPSLSVGAPPTSKQAEVDAYNKERAAWGLPPIK